MTIPSGFYSALQVAAKGPYGLAAYLILALVICFLRFRGKRLDGISKVISKIPTADRAALLAREYGVTPRSGVSAEQWIRQRKQLLIAILIGFIIFVAGVIVIVALLNPSPNHISGPATAVGTGSTAVTGDGNQIVITPPQEEKQKLRDETPDKKRRP